MRIVGPAILTGLLIAALPALPQALTEHAAAAAGATIGTAAGKTLTTGMNKIFGSVDQVTSHAAGPAKKEDKEKKKPEQAAAAAGADDQASGEPAANREKENKKEARARARRGQASAAKTEQASEPSPAAVEAPAPPPAPKEPALADLLGVQSGTKEEQLSA